jgi:penicillin-binding protein 2
MDFRLLVWRIFMMVGLFLLVGGLYSFQVAQADRYVKLATDNRLRFIRIPPPRGVIYDANGLSLAENVRTFDIKGYPLDLSKEGVFSRIAVLFQRHGIPFTEEDLARSCDRQFWAPFRAVTLVSNLTLSQVADLVTDPEFVPQLFPFPVWRRIYPAGPLAAHVTGYVGEITREELQQRGDQGYLGGDQLGKAGIERFYEEQLRGQAGEEAVEVDARGRRLRQIDYRPPAPGADIRLTLDLGAQRVAAELMSGRRGVLLAMDVHTGALRVFYSSPTYDVNPLTWGVSPSEWGKLVNDPDRPMLNRAIGGVYPPGSVFKVVPALLGLASGTVTASTTVHCPGYMNLGDRTFRCWQRWGHGRENLVTAIRDSCDVYFYQLGLWLGADALVSFAERFGIGKLTGVDLPGEVEGTAAGREWKKRRLNESWYQGDTVNYSIGQGFLLMTPLQVARMAAVVANGGKLVTPHFAEGHSASVTDLQLPQEALRLVRKGLEEVVRTGTGKPAGAFGVEIAGKTGTAQNAHGEDHAWFFGYAPAKDPKLVAVALVEGGGKGSSVAGPLVAELLAYLCLGERRGNEGRGGQ